MSDKSYARSYECVLVKDYVLKMAVLGDVNVLHDNAVLDRCVLCDRNTSEEYGFLNLAVDPAAVGYDRIAHIGVVEIQRRSLVLDLCVDRLTAPEKVISDRIL